jgi:hypothetical protein
VDVFARDTAGGLQFGTVPADAQPTGQTHRQSSGADEIIYVALAIARGFHFQGKAIKQLVANTGHGGQSAPPRRDYVTVTAAFNAAGRLGCIIHL